MNIRYTMTSVKHYVQSQKDVTKALGLLCIYWFLRWTPDLEVQMRPTIQYSTRNTRCIQR